MVTEEVCSQLKEEDNLESNINFPLPLDDSSENDFSGKFCFQLHVLLKFLSPEVISNFLSKGGVEVKRWESVEVLVQNLSLTHVNVLGDEFVLESEKGDANTPLEGL